MNASVLVSGEQEESEGINFEGMFNTERLLCKGVLVLNVCHNL